MNDDRTVEDRFSDSLNFLFPGIGRRLACPVCLNLFELDVQPNSITRGHVYPDALGGDLWVPECSSCNNELGTAADKHVVLESKWSDVLRGKGYWDGELTTEHGTIRGEFRYTGNGWHIKETGKKTNPDERDRVMDYLGGGKPTQFSAVFRTFNPEKRTIGLVHSAFLAMFRFCGYEWALSKGGKYVSSQLLDHRLADPLDRAVVQLDRQLVRSATESPVGVLVAADGARCFFVLADGAPSTSSARVVLLPGFEAQHLDWFRSILHEPRANVQFSFGGPIPSFEEMTRRDWIGFGHYVLLTTGK